MLRIIRHRFIATLARSAPVLGRSKRQKWLSIGLSRFCPLLAWTARHRRGWQHLARSVPALGRSTLRRAVCNLLPLLCCGLLVSQMAQGTTTLLREEIESKVQDRRPAQASDQTRLQGWLGSPAEKPNIIIILADDLGYGDLGCYGHPTIRTPHLDRMAAEGIRFTDFYAPAPVCTPSRAGILTGKLPVRIGMAGSAATSVLLTDSTGGLPTNEVTIAAALHAEGYATACIGKWHLGHLPQFLPLQFGFEHFYGVRFANNMEPAKHSGRPKLPLASLQPKREWWKMALLRDNSVIEPDTDPHTLTQRYTAEAIEFIRNSRGKPFFLYLAHTYPHAPLFASSDFAGRSRRGLYGDTVEELDWSVGVILKTLEDEDLSKRTCVFFTSDNGPSLSLGLAGGSSGGLRGGKGSTWEGGCRVPAVAWWPGKVKAGSVCRDIVSALDLYATCLSMAHVKLNWEVDSLDLTPVLFQGARSSRETVLYYDRDQLFAIRRGPYKLHLRAPSDGKAKPFSKPSPPWLFDLACDPGERFENSDDHPDIVFQLHREAERIQRGIKPVKSQF